MEPVRVCTVCKDTFARVQKGLAQKVLRYTAYFEDHHRTIKSFADAIQEGCVLCSHVQAIAQLDLHTVKEDSYLERFRCYPYPGEFMIETPDNHKVRFISADEGTNALESNTNSKTTFSQLRSWLSECLKNHTACCGNAQPSPFTPTRLMNVGGKGSKEWSLLICEEEENLRDRSYLTLSHRWGDGPVVKLMQANLASLCQGSLIRDLPATFRDAIAVAHELSAQYIWIDSLCIVQDSPDDWAREASRMRDVYSNSLCNVIAAQSMGPDGGLFRSRDLYALETFELEAASHLCYNEPDTTSGNKLWQYNDSSYAVSDAPLFRRGWVLQEQMLAPRALHFGARQVIWECREKSACESRSSSEQALKLLTLDDEATKTSVTARQTWQRIVEEYTTRDLSYVEDRLVALAGIAGLYHSLTGDTYLAGLWKSSLPHFLCWKRRFRLFDMPGVDQETIRGHDIRRATAPSWSWGKFDASVTFGILEEEDHCLIEILETVVEPSRGDVFGQIASGRIVVKGDLTAIHVKTQKEDSLDMITTEDGYDSNVLRGNRSQLDFPNENYDDKHLSLLPMLWTVGIDDYSGHTQQVNGLILEKSFQGASEFYERVGAFTLYMVHELDELGIKQRFTPNPLPPYEWQQLPPSINEASESRIIHLV